MIQTILYPEGGIEKLELDKIVRIVEDNCTSSLGLRFARKMHVTDNYNFIMMALLQVKEFKALIELDESFPIDSFHDLGEQLLYLEIENSVLTEEQFFIFMQFLKTIKSIHQYFKKRAGTYANLEGLLEGNDFNDIALNHITRVINEEGKVKSGVSKELDKIRAEIRQTERALEKKFESILQAAQAGGWLAAGSESLKNGRRVLTLHAEHKRKIKGIIHDESASGKTVFLEPEQTIEISNDLFELRQEEKREIYRILKTLSDAIRPEAPEIRFYQKIAGLYDFIRAKALLAQQLNAHMPDLKKSPVLNLINANHPLLLLHNQSLKRKTIPLKISLNEEERILIISGPNAGGKSVALKSIGLIQVMLQCGMLVPVSPDSKMAVFSKICIEVGDHQSIENDLSTYSSHLSNLKEFLKVANATTLFLIDEFGTGTDPMFGGAIAEAVLEGLNQKKSFGVVTTHYSNLKLFASNSKGVINGSMLFDIDTMNPLYILKIGEAGSSHAFEIAKKIGLPSNIINKAKSKVDTSYQNFDALLSSMETDKHWLDVKQEKLDKSQKELDALTNSYARLKNDIEKQKQQIITDAKQKALEGLEKVNKKFEKLLQDFNVTPEKKSMQTAIRKEIDQGKQELKAELKIEKEKTEIIKKPVLELKVGATVKLDDGNQTGIVEEIRKDKALVAFNNMKTLVSIKELEVIELPKVKIEKRIRGIDYDAATKDFNPSLDLRGMRADEALATVESQLDKAMILGMSSLRILHGKGDGILRRAIRELLKKYDIVKEVKSEHPDFGGEGITLVELK